MSEKHPKSLPVKRISPSSTTLDDDELAILGEDHPYQWGGARRWLNLLTASYCDGLTFLVSMMLAPSVPQVLQTFRPDGSDKALGSFCVTVYILGFCIGPLLIGPLSDLYGRAILLRISIVLFTIFTVACALSPSLELLIVFRFCAGMFGGAPMAIGGAAVADMYPSGKRSGPLGWYSVGTVMGPTIGPVIGAAINGTLSWRWVFWIASIMAGVCAFGLIFLFKETHVPTLLRWRRLGGAYHTYIFPKHFLKRCATYLRLNDDQSAGRRLQKAAILPAKLAFLHIGAFLMLLYMLISNGLSNMILSSLGSIYQSTFRFPAKTAGLAYLPIGIGGTVAMFTIRHIATYIGNRRGGPEKINPTQHALLILILTAPLISIGLLWYGWSSEEHNFWFVPMPGLFLFGYAFMSVRVFSGLFLVEITPGYSGVAMAAHTIASSVGGAIIPLSTFPLYGKVGLGWGNSVIALVNISIFLIPLSMLVVSRKGRISWKVNLHE